MAPHPTMAAAGLEHLRPFEHQDLEKNAGAHGSVTRSDFLEIEWVAFLAIELQWSNHVELDAEPKE